MQYFFLSIPVFYVIGIVSFIKWLSSKNKAQNMGRREFLTKLISELNTKIISQPEKSLSQTVEEFKLELQQTPEKIVNPTSTQVSSTPQNTNLFRQDLGSMTSNWYSDNSINLLLYIGAFLIVASASIFVGFQWESISGIDKSIIITVLTAAWFIFGMWFYFLPKVKSAGLTFLGIGALLIPFTATAWYNFVLKDLGISLGTTWFVSSLIAACVYFWLLYSIRKPFFSYLINISGLSLVFSLVQLNELPQIYYVLGSLIVAIVFLLLRIFIKSDETQAVGLYQRPLEHCAQILLPISLFYGLFNTLSQSVDLFSAETTLALALSGLYYFIWYIYSRKTDYLGFAETILLATLVFFFNWQDVETLLRLYGLFFSSLLLLGLSAFYKNKNDLPAANITFKISILSSIFWYIASQFLSVQGSDLLLFAAIVSAQSFLSAIYLGHTNSRYLGIIFAYIALYHITKLTKIPEQYVPLAFTALSYTWYSLSFLFTDSEKNISAIYKTSAYIALILVPLLFGSIGLSYRFSNHEQEFYALISGYLSLGLFAFESWRQQDSSLGYFTSGIGMVMYEWQINYWEFSEQQWYTLPLALYFMVLAFLRWRKGDTEKRTLLDGLAMFTIIIPTLFQSFGLNGAYYALLLGVEGSILVMLGNSLRYSTYTYAGIIAIFLAVISQMYDYLLSLPRWAITGIGGLVFIVLALYLLIYRKEQHHNSP